MRKDYTIASRCSCEERNKPSFDQYVETAKKHANKSNLLQKHCALLLYRGQILSIGINYHIPGSSVHAEVDAINKAKKKNKNLLKYCTMIVIRINQNDWTCKLSTPCDNCSKHIARAGIKNVYFSV
jgi:deoxycytidylate deaminase